MTTAKAMLVNSAVAVRLERLRNPDLTRFRQGWGMPDLKNLYDLRETLIVIDETDLIGNGETNTYEVERAGRPDPRPVPGDARVRRSRRALPFSDQHRINDLTR